MDALLVIAASAGGVAPLRRIVAGLPVPCAASAFVGLHIGSRPSVLPSLPAPAGGLPAAFAQDGAPIEAGHIDVAPPDRHMSLEPFGIRLSRGPKVHNSRPAAAPLFVSAAEAYREWAIAIVLHRSVGFPTL